MQVKTLIGILLCLVHFASCQNREGFVKVFKTGNCNISEFNSAKFNELAKSQTDSIRLSEYNQFIGDTKISYFKNGTKKNYMGIGKVSTTPLVVQKGKSKDLTKVYNKIFPICKTVNDQFINIYTLHYSATDGRLEVIVLDKKYNIISGLTLLKGELIGSRIELNFEQVKSKLQNKIYIQERASESPESTPVLKRYQQRADGYFEELVQTN